jgi:hypothetical protein
VRRSRERGRRAAGAGLLAAAVLALLPGTAAAIPPALGDAWVSQPSGTSIRLSARIYPEGLSTTYRFEYISKAAYEANLAAAKDGFSGAKKAPAGSEAPLGSGSFPLTATQTIGGLTPDTAYRYRVLAKNSSGTSVGSPLPFATYPLGGPLLADGRAWELVSPAEKNGGRVAPPGTIAGGGLLQGAAQGGELTFSSSASFGDAQGAPPGSQYLARRSAAGWSSENLTTPILSGSYDADDGVPYRLFSADLTRALMLNGDPCRGDLQGCPVANPPPPGSGAPVGYQNYYLRTSATGAFAALLGASELAGQDPGLFEVSLVGTTPDLHHAVLSTCAALTPGATEVPLGGGCDPGEQNLYRWSAGAGLELLNASPGAELAAQSRAISVDGERVYWRDPGSANLYLRQGGATHQVDADAGGGGTFQTASVDGSVAYFTKAGHLWRYSALADLATDLTLAGGVAGVLGASEDGGRLYYQDAAGLELREGGASTTIAAGAEIATPNNWPPTTGTARVSADGTHLLFSSKESLTGYDNTDLATGQRDAQLFLYDAGPDSLTCISCNPTNARPIGPSSIPGSIPNGTTTNSYRPRALVADARRVFFDSKDALVLTDTNAAGDVYEWRALGEGSCSRAGGCVSLISGGRDAADSGFADASADGTDVFFLTEASLVGADPGSLDVYDARIGGGFAEALSPIPCEGDSCQFLPSEPTDPTLTTLLSGLGNPKVRYHRYKRRASKGKRAEKRCKPKSGARQAKRRCKGKRGGRR